MNDDYLWDRSGDPDPEVHRLEKLLREFRHDRPLRELPERVSVFGRLWLWFPMARLAVAASVLATVAGAWLALHLRNPVRPSAGGSTVHTEPSWNVASLEGAPKVGSSAVAKTARLAVGEWLETNGESRARISVNAVGQVEVDPNTRLRLIETRATEHRLALARGTIHAMIWAPPGEFLVDTPSAVAIDLGCAYTLSVDDQGAGLVRVTFGWVGFRNAGRESFVPESALCATRPGVGPGTPYFADAPLELRAALAKLDFEKLTPESRESDLEVVLSRARKRDALTLWHLLSRVDGTDRERVYRRLAKLVPPPEGVTRQGVLAGDRKMLDLWWDQLGLGDTSLWRRWEHDWAGQSR